ncbi:hypothetical protein IG631_17351 [Alternaria alternata]|nr:hypothetical protein IG631_17351 [Alternaria alternata]
MHDANTTKTPLFIPISVPEMLRRRSLRPLWPSEVVFNCMRRTVATASILRMQSYKVLASLPAADGTKPPRNTHSMYPLLKTGSQCHKTQGSCEELPGRGGRGLS